MTEATSDRQKVGDCVLMFSGGRDSTIAAVRLARAGFLPTLVTITSDHLLGIDRVKQRLIEIAPHMPVSTKWLRIDQPTELATDTSFYEQTCLPCHHAYVVVAAVIARGMNVRRLALGYTGYQAAWPEQTPLAVTRLKAVLADFGIILDLPVADLASRHEAEATLKAIGLSSASLEQKCSRQVTNMALDDDKLRAQVSLWERAIRLSMSELDRIPVIAIENATLGELVGASA